jgi:hypothetical protein
VKIVNVRVLLPICCLPIKKFLATRPP